MKLIANKVAEKDIRDWLSEQGYLGQTAKFGEIELHAIKPPGWLQVFRFDAEVKRQLDQKHVKVFGVLRDDERYRRLEIQIFESFTQRTNCLNEWSQGLITTKKRHQDRVEQPESNWILLVPALVILVLIFLTIIVLKFFGPL